MVYQIFNDGIDRHSMAKSSGGGGGGRPNSSAQRKKKLTNSKGSLLSDLLPNYLSVQTESRLAALLIVTIKIVLFLYDLISLPIYCAIQRPDKRAREAQRVHARQVDASTWIRMHKQTHPILSARGRRRNGQNTSDLSGDNDTRPAKVTFMGSTLDEIFARSIERHSSKQCLGYRAVVTCPVLTLNELGEHVMQDKSFRSDYTWYTFSQIGQRVQDIASGLYFNGVYPQTRALFMAGTSLEWFCAAQACFQLAIQVVLAADVADCTVLKRILDETHCECILVSSDKLRSLCQLIDTFEHTSSCSKSSSVVCQCFALKRIIIIDWPFVIDFNEKGFNQLGESLNDLFRSGRPAISVLSIGQIEESGMESPIELRCSRALATSECNNVQQSSAPTATVANGSQKRGQDKRRLSVRRTSESSKLAPGTVDDATQVTENLHDYHRSSALKLLARPKDLAIISYTFGPLGQLKAILLTHNQLTRCTNHLFLDGMVSGDDVHCTVLQLDNLVELMIELCVFSHGGSIGYSCNLNTLFYDGRELFARDKSDLQALNPSYLLVRPYILERLRGSLQNYLQSKMNPLVGFVLRNALYEYKKYWAQRHYSTPIVNALFCSQLKQLFGSRLDYILCNGATDSSETKDFFAFMLDLPVIELYGPEEAVLSLISVDDIWDYKRKILEQERAVAGYGWRLFQFDQYQDDDESSDSDSNQTSGPQHMQRLLKPRVNKNNTYRLNSSKNILFTSSVLCPSFGTRIRLEDWEDFRTSDRPYPRGRLVIGGDVVCQGYLERERSEEPGSPNMRAAAADDDHEWDHFFQERSSTLINWFRTGDIARAFPNGSFEIISAISDLIRMADGQFVSLSQIEHILRNSRFVDNVCAVCGDDRSFVISLVVPNLRRLALKSPGEANLKQAIGSPRDTSSEPDELRDVEFRREVCNDRLLSEFVSEHLSLLLSNSGLSSIQNRFLLVPEIWTPESELVTPAFEPKRQAIQKFYATDIQSIVGTIRPNGDTRRLSARRYKMRKSSSPPKLL